MKQSLQCELLARDGVLGRMGARRVRLMRRKLETGLERMDSRPEDQDLAPLRPLLAKAQRRHGGIVELETRWHMAATDTGGRLEASLWYGDLPGDAPRIRLTVTRATRTKLSEMWSSEAGLAALREPERIVALSESASLERRIAWAWLLPGGRASSGPKLPDCRAALSDQDCAGFGPRTRRHLRPIIPKSQRLSTRRGSGNSWQIRKLVIERRLSSRRATG